MPKTVDQLIADRKKAVEIVYKIPVEMHLWTGRASQSKSYTIETPVKASYSIEASYHSGYSSATLSLENIIDSKIISTNYQFSFGVGKWEQRNHVYPRTVLVIIPEKSSEYRALASTKVDIKDYLEEWISKSDSTKVIFGLWIKYVGNPRLRNKLYEPISYNSKESVLKNMLEKALLSDFKFIVKGKEFKVHKSVMAAASPMLLKMFTIDMAENKEGESRIDHIEPEVFDAMLKFIYKTEVPTDVDRRELYAAAHYYEIEPLKDLCEQEVHTSLVVDNALEIFSWAYPYEELEELKYDAWDVIKLQIIDKLDITKDETADFQTIKDIVEQVKVTKQMLADLGKSHRKTLPLKLPLM